MEQLLFVVPVFLGACLAVVVGRRVFTVAGFSQKSVRKLSALCAAATVATWLVFLWDGIASALSENGPEFYRWSTYVKYREFVYDEWPRAAAVGAGYMALAATLAIVAPLAFRRGKEPLGVLLGGLACLAVALPAMLPALLPRAEWGKDPVFSISPGRISEGGGGYPPGVCLLYGVQKAGEPDVQSTVPGKVPAELCLALHPTPEAHRLTRGPVDFDEPSIYDLANAVNEAGVEPYDELDPFEVEGVQVQEARWTNPP